MCGGTEIPSDFANSPLIKPLQFGEIHLDIWSIAGIETSVIANLNGLNVIVGHFGRIVFTAPQLFFSWIPLFLES